MNLIKRYKKKQYYIVFNNYNNAVFFTKDKSYRHLIRLEPHKILIMPRDMFKLNHYIFNFLDITYKEYFC